jgi:hypothetical protein
MAVQDSIQNAVRTTCQAMSYDSWIDAICGGSRSGTVYATAVNAWLDANPDKDTRNPDSKRLWAAAERDWDANAAFLPGGGVGISKGDNPTKRVAMPEGAESVQKPLGAAVANHKAKVPKKPTIERRPCFTFRNTGKCDKKDCQFVHETPKAKANVVQEDAPTPPKKEVPAKTAWCWKEKKFGACQAKACEFRHKKDPLSLEGGGPVKNDAKVCQHFEPCSIPNRGAKGGPCDTKCNGVKCIHTKVCLSRKVPECAHASDCPELLPSDYGKVCNMVCGGHHCTHWSTCEKKFFPKAILKPEGPSRNPLVATASSEGVGEIVDGNGVYYGAANRYGGMVSTNQHIVNAVALQGENLHVRFANIVAPVDFRKIVNTGKDKAWIHLPKGMDSWQSRRMVDPVRIVAHEAARGKVAIFSRAPDPTDAHKSIPVNSTGVILSPGIYDVGSCAGVCGGYVAIPVNPDPVPVLQGIGIHVAADSANERNVYESFTEEDRALCYGPKNPVSLN